MLNVCAQFVATYCAMCQTTRTHTHTDLSKEVVELLVGQVDAQLLEAVFLKLLKSKDVQDAFYRKSDKARVRRPQSLVVYFFLMAVPLLNRCVPY